jgi:zinc transport system substrate-binding protein
MRIVLMKVPVLRSLVSVLAAVLAGVLAAGALTGCAAFSKGTVTARDGVQVAAAFYPLQWVSERVAGDDASVVDLTTPGMEPHDLELDVRRAAEVSRADLVVYEGGFQPAVDTAVHDIAAGRTLDVAKVVPLVPFRDHGVDSGEPDPHFWQDPLLLARVGAAVARQLAAIDPTHAATYRANAAAVRAQLTSLDRAYRHGLSHCARHTVVVSHDAFGYLERYGVRMDAILGLSPTSEPTPADIARLQRVVREEGVTTVFSEDLAPRQLAEQLARDTGVRSAVLDPVEGLSDRTAGQTYLSLMRGNLTELEEANGCRPTH